jgi:hypothetical protein
MLCRSRERAWRVPEERVHVGRARNENCATPAELPAQFSARPAPPARHTALTLAPMPLTPRQPPTG